MVVFAALTWEASDFEDSDHIINIFGRTEDGRSVYCKITNYCPYFYILLPDKVQHKSDYEINIISVFAITRLCDHAS